MHNQDTDLQERAFIVGSFSLLDTLLSMPMTDIVNNLNLHEDIKSALTQRAGPLGQLLLLVETLEVGNFDAVEEQLKQLPNLDAAMLNEAQMAAIRWVSSLNESK